MEPELRNAELELGDFTKMDFGEEYLELCRRTRCRLSKCRCSRCRRSRCNCPGYVGTGKGSPLMVEELPQQVSRGKYRGEQAGVH